MNVTAIKAGIAKYKTALGFSLSSGIMSFLTMVSGIIIIRWLSPQEMGMYNSLIIIPAYIFFLQLGVFSGLNRELPFHMGKGDPEMVDKLASTALYISITCSVITTVLAGLSILVLTLTSSHTLLFYLTLFTVALLSISQFYTNYLTVTFRTNASFSNLALVYFYQSGIILFSLVLVYFFKYNGLLLRTVLLSYTLLLLVHVYRPFRIKAKFDRASFGLLLKTGIPLFSFAYLQSVAMTLNRLILIHFGGVLLVGYYSPALAIYTGMSILPSILAQYLYPQMSYSLGKEKDYPKLWSWVKKSIFMVFAVSMALAIVGWFLIPPLISRFFPGYISGITATQLSLLAGVFSSATIGFSVLFSMKSWKWVFTLIGFKYAAYLGLMTLFASMMNPLNGVALGLLISDFLYLLLGFYFCYHELVVSKRTLKIEIP